LLLLSSSLALPLSLLEKWTMMRSLVILSTVFLVQADIDVGSCSLDGARAMDDLLDGATYIWASVKRCQKGATGDTTLCVLDIASAVESVNSMMNVILKAVKQCGHLDSTSAQCGLAVGGLTRSFAGMSAATAGILAKCPTSLNNNIPKSPLVYNLASLSTADQQTALASAQSEVNSDAVNKQASFAQCLVDVKDLTTSLFKGIKRIMTLTASCDDSTQHCAHNSLKLVASLSSMGQFLSLAVGRCSANTVANKALRTNSECAGESSHLVRHVSNVARAGIDLADKCQSGADRLYEIEHGNAEAPSSTSMTLGLAASLPLVAVLSFVGGSRFAKARGQEVAQDEQ